MSKINKAKLAAAIARSSEEIAQAEAIGRGEDAGCISGSIGLPSARDHAKMIAKKMQAKGLARSKK